MNRLRPAVLAAALLLSAPALSACAAAATDEVYTPTEGVNNRDGEVDVLHALVVSDGQDGGRLIAGLVNNNQSEDDGLAGVEVAEGDAQVQVGEGDTEIPAGGILQLADPESAEVIVSGVSMGGYVRVTFTFDNAEEATLNVPVLAPGEDYEGVEVPNQVTPSETGAVGQDPHSEEGGEE